MTGGCLAVLMGCTGSVRHHNQQGGTKGHWEEGCRAGMLFTGIPFSAAQNHIRALTLGAGFVWMKQL